MNSQLIYPMFAMVLLTFAVGVYMFRLRVGAVKSGQVKIGYFRLYDQTGIPEQLVKSSRHFSNLFETPILFYVVCTLGILFAQGLMYTIFAWLYVASRGAHALVHLGSNRLGPRMRIYGLSWLILLGMWVLLIWSQLGVATRN